MRRTGLDLFRRLFFRLPVSTPGSCGTHVASEQLISLQQFAALRWLSGSSVSAHSMGVVVEPEPYVAPVAESEGAVEEVSGSESDGEAVMMEPVQLEFLLQTPVFDFIEQRRTRLPVLEPGEEFREEVAVGDKTLVLETGKLARLADGSAVACLGDTRVLVTAVCDAWKKDDRNPGMPLSVDYRERLYAIGKIPMTYTRREGAPKDREVLCGRTIDRAIRPLFAPGFNYDSQISASVLSAGGELDPLVLSINAASVALMSSDIPWDGPVAAVQVAQVNGSLCVNPTIDQLQEADFAMTYAGTRDKTVMIEAEGQEVSESKFIQALQLAHREAKRLLAPQISLAKRCRHSKREAKLTVADPSAARVVAQLCREPIERMFHVTHLTKTDRAYWLNEIKNKVMQELKAKGYFRSDHARVPGSGCVCPADINITFEAVQQDVMKKMAFDEGLRVDGRGLIDLRPIYCEVNSVPVVHGSCLFQRGETQSLCSVTVGGTDEQQRLDSLMGETRKRLMVHYAFPSFCVNETGRGGYQPNRRELGHSNLVEKALRPVMPQPDVFPFTVRLNAETLMSSGSSSMAAVCGGALALVDAGIPVKSLVAGVSIGLLAHREGDDAAPRWKVGGGYAGQNVKDRALVQYELLTDIQGVEDFFGDMDLKVSGTRHGITAAQLDVKLDGVTIEVLEAALERAKAGRLAILDVMEKAVPANREEAAPRFDTIEIEKESISRIIGPSGDTAKRIEAETGARLEIQNTGQIRVFAPTSAQYEAAEKLIANLSGLNIKEGYTYRVKVMRLMDYGAFVEFESGLQALLHISEISHHKVRSVDEVLREGQEFEVLCTGRDARGNIKISRKALLPLPAGMSNMGRHKVTLGAPRPRPHDVTGAHGSHATPIQALP